MNAVIIEGQLHELCLNAKICILLQFNAETFFKTSNTNIWPCNFPNLAIQIANTYEAFKGFVEVFWGIWDSPNINSPNACMQSERPLAAS